MKKHPTIFILTIATIVNAETLKNNSSGGAESQLAIQSVNGVLGKAIHLIVTNSSWQNYAQYLDYPDAGVPDCGIFIESYTLGKPIIKNSHAMISVSYLVNGEFAGTDYYVYPHTIKRIVNYSMILNNRSWEIKEESGMTEYVMHYGSSRIWKIYDGDIRVLDSAYLTWHMNYYNRGSKIRVLYQQPLTNCWNLR